MEIVFNTIKKVNNSFLDLEDVEFKPIIKIKKKGILTLLMYDPDAVGGNKIHWLITNIIDNNISIGNIIFEYQKPNPPRYSGVHHYIFCLFDQDKFMKPIYIQNRYLELIQLFEKMQCLVKLIDMKFFLISS